MKSIRDAKMNIEAVSHYSSRLAKSPDIERSEFEHTRSDAPSTCDWESEPEMTVACAVCPLKKELNGWGKEEVYYTFWQETLQYRLSHQVKLR